MGKSDIQSREDVSLIVRTFYGKVRIDDHIGPIFNKMISDWETHFEVLIDFWVTNVFHVRAYKGNPPMVHQKVDEVHDHVISPEHFGTWLRYWFETIDELFQGKLAELMKHRARNMSTHLFLRIVEARKAT